ncbi:MAG: peptidoglycan DD-metalloendopeptidase family protein [Rhodobacteraceae bacterium]|nr:peptidoglycan DD-metalloendopeptidase family protein [Paracoccaceae bacterium]
MMKRLILALLLASPLHASPAEEALEAMAQIEAASEALADADSGRDRVSALTQTVHAFEDGLSAVRSSLRGAVQEEARLTAGLAAKEAEVAQLLSVLQVIGKRSTPQILLHPEGPTGAARSGMILTDVTPALQEEVSALRAELTDVTVIRQLQQDAAKRLQEGLVGIQEARSALATAIADREPLPKRFTEDPVKTAVLIAASETLEAFASGLSEIAQNETPASLPSAPDLRGTLALPARGTLLRAFQEADAAGITRPGIILATRPNALVTAPSAGTVRFQGPLLDYGNVMILEPARDVLLVLGGLSEVYVQAGDVVAQGDPLGLMGDSRDSEAATASTNRSETLYIEVRENEETANPEEWFAMQRN